MPLNRERQIWWKSKREETEKHYWVEREVEKGLPSWVRKKLLGKSFRFCCPLSCSTDDLKESKQEMMRSFLFNGIPGNFATATLKDWDCFFFESTPLPLTPFFIRGDSIVESDLFQARNYRFLCFVVILLVFSGWSCSFAVFLQMSSLPHTLHSHSSFKVTVNRRYGAWNGIIVQFFLTRSDQISGKFRLLLSIVWRFFLSRVLMSTNR